MTEPATSLSSVEEIRALRTTLSAQGKKLVFTNGVFDILHAGHVRYLQEARALGDALVVALNADDSVRALKGPTRPVNTLEDRAEVLRALRWVDAVVAFEEPRVTGLIGAIWPHVYAKGGDYTVESLNAEERNMLGQVGAEIHILPLVPGRSTTATLERLQQEPEPEPEQNPAEPSAPDTSSPLRLGVLGSGRGSNFKAILEAIGAGTLNAEVQVVISDIAEAPILQLANDAGLPALFVDPGPDPRKLPAPAQKEICDHLKRHQVQVVVLAGFMRLVKDPLLTEFRDRIVNIHPSLLPKYKGVAAWKQALEAGELEAGCTVHLVNAEVDAGQILAQEEVPIRISDTAEELHQRIQEKEHVLLPAVLHEWRERGLRVE